MKIFGLISLITFLSTISWSDPVCTCTDTYMGCERSLCGTGRRWIVHSCSYYLPSGFGCDNVYVDLCTPDPLCFPPPACVPNCSCSAGTCNTTTCDDGCGGTCAGSQDCSTPPPPGCVPNATCTGLTPACGMTGPGVNNCGSSCVMVGPVCPPPPPPPPSPCNPGMVCGTLKDGETGLIPLAGRPIEIRDSLGFILKTVYTDTNGNYSLPMTGALLYVVPIPDRMENVIPFNTKVTTASPLADFKIYRVAATVKAIGKQGDFVVITTISISGLIPPEVRPLGVLTFSKVIDSTNTTAIKVPYGTYWMTCWRMTNQTYAKLPSVPVGVVKALDEVPLSCQIGG